MDPNMHRKENKERARAEYIIKGADKHVLRVRDEVKRQAFLALGLTAGFAALIWFSNFIQTHAGEAPASTHIVLRPTSGSNILAAYALLGALLFGLQVWIRDLNRDADLLKQIDDAEAGRRRIVSVLSASAGAAGFMLSILCLYWFVQSPLEIDYFRVFGPAGASLVLAFVSAETLVAAELPDSPRLREALQKRGMRTATRAFSRLPRKKPTFLLLRCVSVVLGASTVSWLGWFVCAESPNVRLCILAAAVSVVVASITFVVLIFVVVARARRRYLDGVMTVAMYLLILIAYALSSWIAFMELWGPDASSGVYRAALASLSLYLWPVVLIPIVSARTRSDGVPGVILYFASRKLWRIRQLVREGIDKANGKAQAKSGRRSLLLAAAWFSCIPFLSHVLIKKGRVGLEAGKHETLIRTAHCLSWAFLVAYVISAYVVALVWR
jgi:hypothetical protein